MIEWNKINQFDTSTNEGKLLLAAISILTSIEEEDIKSGKWGGMTHPDTAMEKIVELVNKIYYREEWELEQERIKRDNKLKNILE